jgi:hypothetical protein
VPTVWLGAVLVVCGLPRLWLAVTNHGMFWPDEIHQSLEPAHRLAFGYGFVAWEFREGARSWLLPALIAPVLKAGAWLTGDAIWAPAVSAKVAMAALSVVSIALAMRLAATLAGPIGALVTGLGLLAFPPHLFFSARCMSEMAAAPLLLLATLPVVKAQGEGTRRDAHLLAAGMAAGMATIMRAQVGLVVAGLALMLVPWRPPRSFRALGVFVLGAGLATIAGGILDWITWGAPFHSLRRYIEFNVIEDGSSRFGVEPWGYYLASLASAVGTAGFIIILLLGASARRAPALLASIVAFVLAHSAIPHKELRFLMPVVPLAFALAGAGAAAIAEHARAPRGSRGVTIATLVSLACVMALRTPGLKTSDLGRHDVSDANAWALGADLNELLWVAGRRPDLCGLGLGATTSVWTGGLSYLHRDVPIVEPHILRTRAGREAINHAITERDWPPPPGFHEIARAGGVKLIRRDGTCAPPPAGVTRYYETP